MTEARPDLKLTIDCIVAKDVEEKRKEKKLDKCHKSYFWCEYGQEGSGRSGNKQNETFNKASQYPIILLILIKRKMLIFWPIKGQKM